MEQHFIYKIENQQIIKNLFKDYYNHTSQINYISNKKITSSICSICLDQLKFDEKRIFKCGHAFHKDCIDKWFSKTNSLKCPNCKQII